MRRRSARRDLGQLLTTLTAQQFCQSNPSYTTYKYIFYNNLRTGTRSLAARLGFYSLYYAMRLWSMEVNYSKDFAALEVCEHYFEGRLSNILHPTARTGID